MSSKADSGSCMNGDPGTSDGTIRQYLLEQLYEEQRQRLGNRKSISDGVLVI